MDSSPGHLGGNPQRLLALGGTLVLVGSALIVGYLVRVRQADAGTATPRMVPSAEAAATTTAPSPEDREKVEQLLAGKVTLTFEKKSHALSFKDLGAEFDPDANDNVLPIRLDREKATQTLVALKPIFDRPAQNARLDLEARKVHPSAPGFGLDVFGAVSDIESAARRGETEVALPGVAVEPTVTAKELGIEDVSHVLASFRTTFPIAEKARNDNLKLVASHLDGYVLQPGVEFSFNEVVGARTEKEGYKTAHVIEAGEMVDGMAGGTCQISTTLHGAAYFAGLELTRSIPHSRPSVYVPMGLDATVVYPTTDLKLKNPYDFPVAIHYRVARGEAFVEILGKERPYDKIEFVREVKERIPFETITREDATIAIGHMVVDQLGYPGYKLTRRRVYYKGKKVVKQDPPRELYYPPVVEYVRIGVSPDPNLAPPKATEPHSPEPAKTDLFKLSQ
jgi:vancomycin resistance protein YoaR